MCNAPSRVGAEKPIPYSLKSKHIFKVCMSTSVCTQMKTKARAILLGISILGYKTGRYTHMYNDSWCWEKYRVDVIYRIALTVGRRKDKLQSRGTAKMFCGIRVKCSWWRRDRCQGRQTHSETQRRLLNGEGTWAQCAQEGWYQLVSPWEAGEVRIK